jgi:hypothetical protein
MSQKDAKRLNLAPLEERPGDKNSGQEDPGDLGDPWADKDLPRSTHPGRPGAGPRETEFAGNFAGRLPGLRNARLL